MEGEMGATRNRGGCRLIVMLAGLAIKNPTKKKPKKPTKMGFLVYF
jgi:hypothetical protein